MRKRHNLLHLSLLLAALCTLPVPFAMAKESTYTPTTENLAARQEFQDDKFGIFIHWGVYSVLARGEWVMNIEKMSVEDYEPLAEKFNPNQYNADEWCKLFKEAGAKYVTITSKHHDGFCMYDSAQTDWDIVDRTPYGKDVLKQLAEACERHGLKLFFYYSQVDWHHPEYFPRGKTGLTAKRPESGDFNKYIDYMNAQLSELLSGNYGKISGIWFDGWWDQQTKRFDATKNAPVEQTNQDWRLAETYNLIHKLQPACLIGSNHHIAPFPGEDIQMFERDLPGENKGGHSVDAEIGNLPLETCDTVNKSWGYNAGDKRFKSGKDLVHYLVRAAGKNANFLLNVGPKPDGTIDSESAERLREVGKWLHENGDSIYGTRGGPILPLSWGATTAKNDKVFLHILTPPEVNAEGFVELAGTESLRANQITSFETNTPIEFKQTASGLLAVKLLPSNPSWDIILVVK